MANDTVSINRIVSIFRDLAIRHEMIADFDFGEEYDINASRQLKYPYLWVDVDNTSIISGANGYKERLIDFSLLVMDRIDMGSSNYQEIISDTHYIIETIVMEMSQHPFYVNMNISLVTDITLTPVIEATDANCNGYRADFTLKVPLRYTYCNSPIEPIEGYSSDLEGIVDKYRIIGGDGPDGATGPAGPDGATGPQGATGNDGLPGASTQKNFIYLKDTLHPLRGVCSANAGGANMGVALTAELIKPLGTFEIKDISVNVRFVTTSGKLILGIYDLNADGLPGNKLVQLSTEYDTSIAGLQTIALDTPYTLQANTNYCVVYQSDVFIPQMRRFAIGSTNNGLTWGTDGVTSKYSRLLNVVPYSSTLPTTFPLTGSYFLSDLLLAVYFRRT